MTRAEHTTQPCEPVAVAAAAGERAAVWRPVADDRGVTLTVRGPDDLWVRAIPGALDQILDNLLSNALSIAPAGSAVAVTWRTAAGLVEVHVVDSGAGLTDDQRRQALQAFWRAPGAAKGGTGLGLALVRKLAEASGGRARLDAAEPTGVDAVVVLPGIG
jgi:signal transduction histidine kinase